MTDTLQTVIGCIVLTHTALFPWHSSILSLQLSALTWLWLPNKHTLSLGVALHNTVTLPFPIKAAGSVEMC